MLPSQWSRKNKIARSTRFLQLDKKRKEKKNSRPKQQITAAPCSYMGLGGRCTDMATIAGSMVFASGQIAMMACMYIIVHMIAQAIFDNEARLTTMMMMR